MARGRAVAAVELALVLLVALASARLFWILFEPAPAIQAPPPAAARSASPTVVSNPFRLAEAPAMPDGAAPARIETSLDLALHGTWVDPERPSAIIRLPGGEQKTFFVGDTICCGATLAGVYTDQVTISRGGVQEALRLPNKGGGTVPPPQVAKSESPQEAQGGALTSFIRFKPVEDPSGSFRLQLSPGVDAALFQSFGLREGDVLVAVNNQPAPENLEGLSQLLADLQGATMISVTVERDGVRLPLDIPLESDGVLGSQLRRRQ